jgi:hypothetical protein
MRVGPALRIHTRSWTNEKEARHVWQRPTWKKASRAANNRPITDSEGRKFPAQASNRYYLPFGLSFGKVKSITNPFLSLSASSSFLNSWASCSQV